MNDYKDKIVAYLNSKQKVDRKKVAKKFRVKRSLINQLINTRAKHLKRKRFVPNKKKEGIVDYFFTHQDNRMSVIAKEFNVSEYTVRKIITKELDRRKNMVRP